MKQVVALIILTVSILLPAHLHAQAEVQSTTMPAWMIMGNAGLDTSLHFLGTVDDSALVFKTNNLRAGLLRETTANSYLGTYSGNALATGTFNVGVGYLANSANTTGSNYIAIGDSTFTNASALNAYSLAIGHAASKFSGAGISNIGIGAWTNYGSGSENIGIGNYTSSLQNTGNRNIAIGMANSEVTKGSNNIAIGYRALRRDTMNGEHNIIIGCFNAEIAFRVGSHNIGIGWYAYARGIADHNIHIGANNLGTTIDATGTYNIGIGYSSLMVKGSGSYNVAIGNLALNGIYTGSNNVAVGDEACSRCNNDNNVAIGTNVLRNDSGGLYNVGIGADVLQWASGSYNAVTGYNSFAPSYFNQELVGSGNTCIGAYNGASRKDTSYQTLAGNNLFFYDTIRAENAAMSYQIEGENYMRSTLLGISISAPAGFARFNCTALGYTTAVTGNNQVRVGNTAVTSIGGYTIWSNISDGRFKENVQEDIKGLDFIKRLRPVTYHLQTGELNKFLNNTRCDTGALNQKAIIEKEAIKYSGFIAQEVEEAAKASNYNFSGVEIPNEERGLYGLRYDEFVVPLVKAVQEQNEQIKHLQEEIAAMKKAKAAAQQTR